MCKCILLSAIAWCMIISNKYRCYDTRCYSNASENAELHSYLIFSKLLLIKVATWYIAHSSVCLVNNPSMYVFTAGACFSRVKPTLVKNPTLVALSQEVVDLIGLSPSETARPDFVEYFSGNKILPGSEPAAHCYCGHQFGNFAGQLGDGCAL